MAKSFSNLAKDGSARVMQVASGIQTYDGASSPNNSPLSYTAADITTLTYPTNSPEVVLYPSTALRISEDATMATYDVIPAGSVYTVGGGRSDYLYIKGDSADGTLNFHFNTV